MTQEIEQLQQHVDEKFDHLEKRLIAADASREKLAQKLDQKQDKFPKGTVIAIASAFVGQLILLAFVWGSQSQQLIEATTDRYTGAEARKDQNIESLRFSIVETDILDNEITLKELRERIRVLEENARNR